MSASTRFPHGQQFQVHAAVLRDHILDAGARSGDEGAGLETRDDVAVKLAVFGVGGGEGNKRFAAFGQLRTLDKVQLTANGAVLGANDIIGHHLTHQVDLQRRIH